MERAGVKYCAKAIMGDNYQVLKGASMDTDCFIITGTSRGIGEATAQLLLENGAAVFGLSRGDSERLSRYPNYFHHNVDLSDTYKTEQTLIDIMKRINKESYNKLCLINNASMVEPLKRIEGCNTDEITRNLQISLIAPIVLTSCFIKHTAMRMNRKIINISSGSGTYPAPDMSIYSTAKAGLNMFTRCVGLEQSGISNPIEIIAVDPGMVETEMQRIARTQPDFAMADYFNKAYADGHLQSTREVAQHILAIIEADIETGKIVNYSVH